jgi:putative phosphoesterase
MSTRIGLISDIHATVAPLREALSVFQQLGVDMILCPGDVVGYGEEAAETIAVIKESHCQTILGNHEVWHLDESESETDDQVSIYLSKLPSVLELTIEGKNVYMVHASPPVSCMDGIKLLDENGEILPEEKEYWTNKLASFNHDILIVGHTHQVFAEQLGKTLVINPGSTKFNHTCAILELPSMKFEIHPLSGKTPIMSWNWGLYFSQQSTKND